jgi:hypothetical protein
VWCCTLDGAWNTTAAIPAKAGIHLDFRKLQEQMDPGFRRDDGVLACRFACNTTLVFEPVPEDAPGPVAAVQAAQMGEQCLEIGG